MAPRKQAKQENGKPKGGRPAGTPNYLSVENLAAALASIEAEDQKQEQSGLDLHATADQLFARNLQNVVVPKYGWPRKAGPKSNPDYTVEKSIAARTGIYGRWVGTLKPYCINTIMQAYTEVMVNGGGKELIKPSGTDWEEVEKMVKEALWRITQKAGCGCGSHKKTVKPDAEQSDDEEAAEIKKRKHDEEEEEDLGLGGEGEEGAICDMPSDWDGGPIYLVWRHLGPFSEDHKANAHFQVEGGQAQAAGDNRAKQRQQEVHGETPSNGAGASASYAQSMEMEALTEKWKAQLQARRDKIEELKLMVEYALPDEKAAAQDALIQWLKANPAPEQPAGLK